MAGSDRSLRFTGGAAAKRSRNRVDVRSLFGQGGMERSPRSEAIGLQGFSRWEAEGFSSGWGTPDEPRVGGAERWLVRLLMGSSVRGGIRGWRRACSQARTPSLS